MYRPGQEEEEEETSMGLDSAKRQALQDLVGQMNQIIAGGDEKPEEVMDEEIVEEGGSIFDEEYDEPMPKEGMGDEEEYNEEGEEDEEDFSDEMKQFMGGAKPPQTDSTVSIAVTQNKKKKKKGKGKY